MILGTEPNGVPDIMTNGGRPRKDGAFKNLSVKDFSDGPVSEASSGGILLQTSLPQSF